MIKENNVCNYCLKELNENNKCINIHCPYSEVYATIVPIPSIEFDDGDLEFLTRKLITPALAPIIKEYRELILKQREMMLKHSEVISKQGEMISKQNEYLSRLATISNQFCNEIRRIENEILDIREHLSLPMKHEEE